MKTNFDFQRNGWRLTVVIDIDLLQLTDNNLLIHGLPVQYKILGLDEDTWKYATLDLYNRFLYFNDKIVVKSYPDNNDIGSKSFNKLKVPDEIIKTIKSYLY